MKAIKMIAIVSCILLFNQCNENEPEEVVCTLNYVYGLHINLIEKSTTNPIYGAVTIIATEGNHEETLENYGSNSSFFGAGERQGTYVLTITSVNYKTFISEPIEVDGDECHVNTQSRTFELEFN